MMVVTIGFTQETEQDSTKTGYAVGKIELSDPNSIVNKYTYDPDLDRYIYTQKLGEFSISYPLILTPEEYQKLIFQEEMRKYFNKKSDALSGKKEGSEEDQRNLLPNFYVNSNFFESVFGGREIEVIPTGTVEMDLGVLYTKQDNPSFSPRNRTNITFDFEQRISLSLLGKVGKRLQVTANYDTESTFDFQNQIKLEYTPTEDDIVRKIEVGNVSLPLNSSLIQGAQSLFGAKVELQFGKTTITGVYSEQNSERNSVNVQGGDAVQDFEKFILDYDENKHFFLAHYFRDNYDRSLANYPFINTNVQVTRIQVWVTNRTNNTQTLTDTRNIVAIQDIGESDISNIGLDTPPPGFINNGPQAFPDNESNDFNPFGINNPQQESILNSRIRDVATVEQGFGTQVMEGEDYGVLENARQLQPNEYTLNTQLGYISLNQRLSNDEILGVAFQYTVGGQVFQVGEFANDGVEATASNPDIDDAGLPPNNSTLVNQTLVVKMLKSPVTNVREPIWDLMMKNIYSLGAFDLSPEDFRFNILYTDPQPLNYLNDVDPAPDSPALTRFPANTALEDITLLRLFNFDNLNAYNDPVIEGDGFFDFVPGLTIDPQNGNIIFTSVEPFGQYLFNQLRSQSPATPEVYDDGVDGSDAELQTYNDNQREYVFKQLYTTTKIQAEQESAEKNKFQLKGRYKSSGVDGIPIGGFNIPQGSVTVTAGGRVLQEGVDYVVNYQFGRVQILDEALLASDIPIQISTESNSLFGQQTKRFTGLNIEHRFSDEFIIGGTLINLNERPITQKANYGFEPINNTIYGFNLNYSTEVPWLTRFANWLPNIETDVESRVSVRGEFAYLQPGSPKGDDFRGETVTYVDDFEASQTAISILQPLSWELSSVPTGLNGFDGGFGNGDIRVNDRRAMFNWYTVDPVFYSNQRPDGITDAELSDYKTRRVFIDEIFEERDIPQGQTQALFPMDVAFYPRQRGPYNYAVAANGGNTLPNPRENFGGIIRAITNTDFEQSNVEFIEFWLLDPFIYPENAGSTGGTISFNLGNISEDVLKDGRKQFENGLPENGGTAQTQSTAFGKVPVNQSLVYAFDTEGQERVNQDLGYDGLSDAQEAAMFPQFAGLPDPANDNFNYFLNTDGGILQRYRQYNGTEGNSPTDVGQNNRGNTTFPTVEDVNRDNTMNTIDSYLQLNVPISPSTMNRSNEFVSDVKELDVNTLDGGTLRTRWVQFRVPLEFPRSDTDQLRQTVGGIEDLRSVRFMRMFLSGFNDDIFLRFATLDLVRGDYRRYNLTLQDGDPNVADDGTVFRVTSVSEETTSNYETPPGVNRERFVNNNQEIREDERSLAITVDDLEADDSRAVYKNFQVDMRQYERLEMFLHAEAIPTEPLGDNELVAFIRMGLDFTDNYYQIELPLTVSPPNANTPRGIWPEANELSLPLELLQNIKSTVLGDPGTYNLSDLNFFNENAEPSADNVPGELRVGIKGNPSFGNVRVVMLGVKNAKDFGTAAGQVWFNELRLSGLKNRGGWAAVANVDANVADFMNIAATGRRSTVGFGGIEQGPNQRSREDAQSYDVSTNVSVGKLLPTKWGVQIPFNYTRGEEVITPQYDPEFLDLELENRIDAAPNQETADAIRERAEDYTRRQTLSVIGLRKNRTNTDTERKPMPYDIENFTFSGTYNQTDHRDFEVQESIDQNIRVGATYEYAVPEYSIEPFKNISVLDSSAYYKPIKDFNFSPLPSSISLGSNIQRQYNRQTFRSFLQGENNIIPELFQRNYLYNWQFATNWDLTKSLRFNYSAANDFVVRNYINDDLTQDQSIGLWDGFFETGTPNIHTQSLQANYDLPLNKIPLLEFVQSTYSYTSNYQWQRGSEIFNNLQDQGIPRLGNTIQNSQLHELNSTLDLQKLYNYVGLKKKVKKSAVRQSSSGIRRDARQRSSEADEPTLAGASANSNQQNSASTTLSAGEKAYNTGIGLLTAVKKIQVSYREDQGIFLPGYLPTVGFIGSVRPTVGFTFGSQSDVRQEAARRGWLTLYDQFNQQYSEIENRDLNIQATVDLLPDLKIDLNANRIYSETYQENYIVTGNSFETFQYNSLTPNTFGNFNISTILIKTAFSQSSQEQSVAFNEFRANRLEVARRLAAENGRDPNDVDDDGFPVGFGRTNQAVLLPAFVAAYSGTDVNNVQLDAFRDVPLPNWVIKYTGFMKLKWFQKNFKRFSLNHAYNAGYTINQFQTNLDFDDANPFGAGNLDQSGNFKNKLLYSNINLTEAFSPLIKLDMETNGSIKILAEIRKDRALSLSFDNNLLTEISGNEYILGLGYRIKDLKIPTTVAGKKRILSSDLNFKADFSFRRNKTIIRYLDIENSQTTAGQNIFTVNFRADYALTRNLTAAFFYDHSFSTYEISTAFPQTTIRSGLSFIYNFGN